MNKDTDPLIGQTLDGRYQLEERIGRGGMGDVYRGTHLLMKQRIAVKVLRPDLRHDETAAKRFAREARGVFRLDHANCVRVYDFGYAQAQEAMYLVMEYVDGRTVGDELCVDGPMSGARAAHAMAQTCAVLRQAHSIGMVHRDLKPDNLMLLRRDDDPDFVKVLDFGLAKLYEPDSSGTTMFSMAAAVTQQGTVFGTPEYMSPEQASGQDLDPRSDLYSAGIVLYEMITGLLPFTGGNFMQTLTKQVREAPVAPSVRRPDLGIDPRLEALVLRCMAKRPQDRPASAHELEVELETLARQLRTAASRIPAALAASETVDLARSHLSPVDAAALEAAAAQVAQAHPTQAALPKAAGRKGLWFGVAAAVSSAVLIVVLVVAGSKSSAESGGDAEAEPATVAQGARLASGVSGGDASVGEMTISDAAVPSTEVTVSVDAAPVDASVRLSLKPRDTARLAAKKRARAHVRAAASARRAGNTLKEIAELDAALKLDKRNREAAYRLGVALIRAHDTRRGCRYLQRAGSLTKARAAARRAGCND